MYTLSTRMHAITHITIGWNDFKMFESLKNNRWTQEEKKLLTPEEKRRKRNKDIKQISSLRIIWYGFVFFLFKSSMRFQIRILNRLNRARKSLPSYNFFQCQNILCLFFDSYFSPPTTLIRLNGSTWFDF